MYIGTAGLSLLYALKCSSATDVYTNGYLMQYYACVVISVYLVFISLLKYSDCI